jgi:hypothetical protein
MAIDEKAYLTRLGGGLFRQIVAFGQLGPLIPGEPGHPSMATSLALTRTFLTEAERLHITIDSSPDLAFVSNRSLWDNAIPPAGYVKDYPALPLSTLVRSYDVMWSLQAERHNAKGPTLRAIVWMCFTHGWEAATRYLFDLQRSGYLTSESTLREMLDLLIRLRNLVSTDQAFVTVIFPAVPRTNQEWLEMPFRETFAVGSEEPEVRDDVGIAEEVLQEALETINRCRVSQTYDEWFLRQLNQPVILSVAKNIFLRFRPQPNLPARAFLDMVEEIMADAHSFHAAGVGGPLLQPSFELARQVSDVIAKLDPHGWKRRVLEERAVLPAALRHLLDREDWRSEGNNHAHNIANQLSPEWRGVSSELAYPVHLALRKRRVPPWTPLNFYPPAAAVIGKQDDQAAQNERAARYWEAGVQEIEKRREQAISLEAAGQLDAALRVYQEVFERYPWCHVLRDRAAHVRQLSGDLEGALIEMCTAVLTDPLAAGHWGCLAEIARSAGFSDTADLAKTFQERLGPLSPLEEEKNQ